MSELSPEGRALFRGARRDLAPSEADRDRVEHALGAQIGSVAAAAAAAGAVAGTATSAAAASMAPAAVAGASAGGAVATVTTSSALLVATKWIGAVALVGGLGAGGAAVYRAERAAPVPVTPPHAFVQANPATPATQPTSASVPVPVPAPVPVPTIDPMAAPRDPESSRPRATRPPVPVGSVGDETRLLREADAALRVGDAARALALLDAHARSYPNGVLAEERAVERVFALCKLGRVDDARVEARRFMQARPDSPLAKSVSASCGGTRE